MVRDGSGGRFVQSFPPGTMPVSGRPQSDVCDAHWIGDGADRHSPALPGGPRPARCRRSSRVLWVLAQIPFYFWTTSIWFLSIGSRGDTSGFCCGSVANQSADGLLRGIVCGAGGVVPNRSIGPSFLRCCCRGGLGNRRRIMGAGALQGAVHSGVQSFEQILDTFPHCEAKTPDPIPRQSDFVRDSRSRQHAHVSISLLNRHRPAANVIGFPDRP